MHLRIVLWALFMVLPVACARGRTSSPEAGQVIRATAPDGLSPARLGAPLDAKFRPLQGPQGQTLFPDAGPPRKTVIDQVRHELLTFQTEQELEANASAWGLFSIGGGTSSGHRFGTYRAIQIEHVLELDDTTKLRRVPNGAVYYPWKIYYGHSYEIVMSGDSSSFHAGVKADFEVASGRIEAFAKDHNLTINVRAKGLKPMPGGGALFAKTEAEIQRSYTPDGEPVPILVEYRQIPGSRVSPAQIEWIEPLEVEVRFTKIVIKEDGTWGTTPWTFRGYCLVNGREAHITNPQIWASKRITDGRSYDLQWVARFEVPPSSRVECGARGWLADHATSGRALAEGKMAEPLTATARMGKQQGTFRARDAKTAYTVHYSIEAIR